MKKALHLGLKVETEHAVNHKRLYDWNGGDAVGSLMVPYDWLPLLYVWALLRDGAHVVLAMTDGSAVDEHVFIRGNAKNPGPVVPRRFLEVFGGTKTPPPKHGSGRLQRLSRASSKKVSSFFAGSIM